MGFLVYVLHFSFSFELAATLCIGDGGSCVNDVPGKHEKSLFVQLSAQVLTKTTEKASTEQVISSDPGEVEEDASIPVEYAPGLEGGSTLAKNKKKIKVVYGVICSNDHVGLAQADLDTWAKEPFSDGRFIVSGPSNFTMSDNKSFIASDCGDEPSDMACKQVGLFVEAVARDADWLVVGHTDHYMLTRSIDDALLQLDEDVKVAYAGSKGCGTYLPEYEEAWKEHAHGAPFCNEVEKSGGFCGGAPYAISKATLRAIVEKGDKSAYSRGKEMGRWPEDISNGCFVRQSGSDIQKFPGDTSGFIQAPYEVDKIREKFEENKLFSVHPLKGEAGMRELHGFINGLQQ